MKEDDPLSRVEKAEEDWITANTLLKRKKPFTSIICFHFQQAAEKYIKAILVLKGSPFPKTHDLTALSKMCEKNGILIGVDEDSLDILSGYAVATRYPGAEPFYNPCKPSNSKRRPLTKKARSSRGLDALPSSLLRS